MWPNNPDEVDNPEVYTGDDLLPIWDIDCLTSYMEGGRQIVIYIGEREEVIQVQPNWGPPDCGMSSSHRFHNTLKENFNLVEEIPIPNWYSNKMDNVIIWKHKD